MKETQFKDWHLYMGCKVQVESISTDTSKPLIYIRTLNPTWFLQYSRKNFKGVKPILRPLSSITDEELIEFIKLTRGISGLVSNVRLWKQKYGPRDNPKYDLVVNYDYYNGKDRTLYLDVFAPKIMIHLLSQHFDLFNLISTNQAIDATTLPTNPYKPIL